MGNNQNKFARPRLMLLKPKQLNEIHNASLRILAETGVNVHSSKIRVLLEDGGCEGAG